MGLIVHHFLGFRPGLDVLTVRPRPVTGLDALDGTLTVRGIRVHVNVKRATGSPSATVDGRAVPFVDGTLRVPYPKGRKTMEIVLAV
jgi:cellobiose phosphorylase